MSIFLPARDVLVDKTLLSQYDSLLLWKNVLVHQLSLVFFSQYAKQDAQTF